MHLIGPSAMETIRVPIKTLPSRTSWTFTDWLSSDDNNTHCTCYGFGIQEMLKLKCNTNDVLGKSSLVLTQFGRKRSRTLLRIFFCVNPIRY